MSSGRMEAQNNAILGLTKELDTIEKDIKKVEEEIAKVSNEQGTLDEEIAKNSDKLGTLDEEIAITSNKLGTLHEEIAITSNKLGTLEEKIAKNFNILETLQKKPLNKRKNVEKEEIQYFRQEHLHLLEEGKDLRKEKADLRKIETRLLDEKADLRKEKADLRKEKEDLRKEKEDLRKEKEDLRKEKEDLRKTKILLLEEKNRVNGLRSVQDEFPLLAEFPRVSIAKSSTKTETTEKTTVIGRNHTVVEDMGTSRKQIISKIWQEKQTSSGTLQYTSEASIAGLVQKLLDDVMKVCNLMAFELIPEIRKKHIRPDYWFVNSIAVPVGVVEVKKPGDSVLENQQVLGQMYDYLVRLPNFYGAQQMIGILTTYREWRLCWLDTKETNALMQKPVSIPLEEVSANRFGTKREWTDYHPDESTEYVTDSESPVVRSPPERKMFVSRIWSMEKENVFPLIASALIKMSQVTHGGFNHPFDDLKSRTLLCVDTNTLYWRTLTGDVKRGKWETCPRSDTKILYILADIGIGETIHMWLACSKSGLVCVLKFFELGDESRHQELLQTECDLWHIIYPQWREVVRVGTFCGRPALIMPHFDSPKRDRTVIGLVRETLETSFASKG